MKLFLGDALRQPAELEQAFDYLRGSRLAPAGRSSGGKRRDRSSAGKSPRVRYRRHWCLNLPCHSDFDTPVYFHTPLYNVFNPIGNVQLQFRAEAFNVFNHTQRNGVNRLGGI